MLKHRLVYGGVLLSVFVGVVTLDIRTGGVTGTSVLIAAFALAALFEFYDLVRRGGREVALVPGLATALVSLGATIVVLSGVVSSRVEPSGSTGPGAASGFAFGGGVPLVLALGSGGIVAAIACVFLAGRTESFAARFESMATTSLGLAYVALPAACFLAVLRTDQGLPWFFFAVLVVKLNDTGAYFVGRSFGKRPLSTASPNKSWEGAIGGAVIGVAVGGGVIGAALLGGTGAGGGPSGSDAGGVGLAARLAVAAVLSFVGQFGDLVESAIKRGLDQKDSGRWLPGIGGILDSIDSVLPVAPFLLALRLLVAG